MTRDEVYEMLDELGLLNERLKCKKYRKTNQAGVSMKSWLRRDESEQVRDQVGASMKS